MPLAVIPGKTLVSTGVVVNCNAVPFGGHEPAFAAVLVALRLEILRSVSVATGVTVAPTTCLPLLVAAKRSVAGATTPASGYSTLVVDGCPLVFVTVVVGQLPRAVVVAPAKNAPRSGTVTATSVAGVVSAGIVDPLMLLQPVKAEWIRI